jgi:NNP family nitrate/nitrite transporter-like MFS transporter
MTSIVLGISYVRWGKSGNFAGEALNLSAILMLVKQRSFFIMLIVFCAGIGGFLGIYTMLPLYLVTEQGMEREIANTLIAISRIPCLAVVFAAGWVTDRFGPKRTLLWALILNGTLTIALGFGEGLWTVVFVFLQPMISACFPPAALVVLSLINPQEIRHIAVSITIPSAFIFGGGIVPILIGTMGDVGLFWLGIAIVGGFILMVSILPWYLVDPEKVVP